MTGLLHVDRGGMLGLKLYGNASDRLLHIRPYFYSEGVSGTDAKGRKFQ